MVANLDVLGFGKYSGVPHIFGFRLHSILGFYIPDDVYNQISLEFPTRLQENPLLPSRKKLSSPVPCPSVKGLNRGEFLSGNLKISSHMASRRGKQKQRWVEFLKITFEREKEGFGNPRVVLRSDQALIPLCRASPFRKNLNVSSYRSLDQ